MQKGKMHDKCLGEFVVKIKEFNSKMHIEIDKRKIEDYLDTVAFRFSEQYTVLLKRKIKDIKAEEEVLTLDEKTGKLVPRKVNTLLDHGIKPIYEMTTEDGRVINTTAEHPYFVKRTNFEDLMGDDLNLPFSPNSIKNPSKSSGFDLSLSKIEKDSNKASGLSCGILSQTTENILSFENKNGLVKCTSLVTNILFSDLESVAISSSDALLSAAVTSNPSEIRNTSNLLFTFSSRKNLSSEWDLDSDIITSSSQISCIAQSCLDMLLCQRGIIFDNLLGTHAAFNHLQNLPDHDPGSIESKLPMANFAVCNNISIDFDSHNIDGSIKVFKHYAKWIEVRYLEIGDEIAVPDYEKCTIKNKALKNLQGEFLGHQKSERFFSEIKTEFHNQILQTEPAALTGLRVRSSALEFKSEVPSSSAQNSAYEGCGINFEKISSIKTLEPQHVYDLAIENIYNFIANGIAAHNTYLAAQSGSVGIGASFASRNLFAAASESLSVNSLAALSGTFTLEENLLSFFNFSVLSDIALAAASDQFNLNSLISFFKSSGISTFNSAMLKNLRFLAPPTAVLTSPFQNYENGYLNFAGTEIFLKNIFLGSEMA